MKRVIASLVTVLCVAVLTGEAHADEQTRQVQQALKEAGFYYGAVDGQNGSETKSALRRFQIRNGLEVTGDVNTDTLSALKIGPDSEQHSPATADRDPDTVERSAPPSPSDGAFLGPGSRPRATPTPAPPPRMERDLDSPADQSELREPNELFGEEGPDGVQLQPFRNESGEPIYRPGAGIRRKRGASALQDFFWGTELEDAGYGEQSVRLASVQSRLRKLGYYKGVPDGLPGPATEEALLNFQYNNRLRPTGRLDDDTLAALDSSQPSVPARRYRHQRPDGPIYRGIWVQ
ncbi:MAG TPA: peptidoglycan-binding domain-containing protein [Chthoniobacterales bacterium]